MKHADDNNLELQVCSLGVTDYAETWRLQKTLVQRRASGDIADVLLTTQHKPVLTMGRGTNLDNLLVGREKLAQRGVGLFKIERGGDITFHGPGQLVLYPIIDLRRRDRDAHRYLRDLERVVIAALADFGLTATTKQGLTGIWVKDHKVGAIGVAVSKWVTYHGVAINVTTDLDYFKLINPCGITEYPVGSISQLLGEGVDIDEFSDALVSRFADRFGYSSTTNVKRPEIDFTA